MTVFEADLTWTGERFEPGVRFDFEMAMGVRYGDRVRFRDFATPRGWLRLIRPRTKAIPSSSARSNSRWSAMSSVRCGSF